MLKIKSKQTDKKFQIYFVEKNPQCFFCGKPTSCGHHIKRKSVNSELRHDDKNMCPVCVECHLKIHMKYRKEMEDEWKNTQYLLDNVGNCLKRLDQTMWINKYKTI